MWLVCRIMRNDEEGELELGEGELGTWRDASAKILYVFKTAR